MTNEQKIPLQSPTARRSPIPLIVTLTGAFVVVLVILYWILYQGWFERRQAEIREIAEQTAYSIDIHLEGNCEYLQLLAERMAQSTLDEAEFQARTSQYVADHPELINVCWADKDFIIRWTAPYEPNRMVIGLELTLPEPERASHSARDTGEPVWTRPFEVIQGAPAFEVYVPIFRDGEFLGTFGGIYAIENVLRHATPQFVQDLHNLALVDEAGTIIYGLPPSGMHEHRLTHKVALDPPGYGVSLVLTDYASGFPWGILALASFYTVLAFGLAWGIISLLRELTEHKRTEESLIESEQRFKELFDNMSSGVAVYEAVDDGQDFVFKEFNKAGIKIENVKIEDLIGVRVTEVFPGVEEFGLLDVFRRVWETGKPEQHPITLYKDDRLVGWRENYVYKLPSGEIVAIYDDATDRKRAEEELRRYEHIVSTSTDMLALLDKDFVYLAANTAYLKAFGKTEDEFIGRSVSEIFGDEFFRTVIKPNADRCLTGQEIRYEDWFEFPFTGRRYMDIAYFPYFGSVREVSGFVVSGRDITDRKLAEEALRESEERYRLLANYATDVIWTTDMDLRLTYFSPSVEKLRGYTPEEALNIPLDKSLTPESYSAAISIVMEEIAKEGEAGVSPDRSRIMELEEIRKDGSTVWTEVIASFLRDENGSPTGIVGITRDITDRKRAEEEIRKFKTIADKANYGVAIADIKGNFIYVNETWAGMHGNKPEDEIGCHLSMLHSEGEMDRVNELNAKILEEGGFSGEEVMHLRNDGTEFPMLMTSSTIADEKGNPIYLAASGIDITDRKLAEEEIKRKNRELEKALKAQREFLSMVSHELRTPLVPIIGYSDLLLDETFGSLPEKAFEPVQVIKRRAQDLTNLIEDLLIVSSFDRDKMRFQIEPLSVSSYVNEVVADFQLVDHLKDVSIEWIGEDFKALADPVRLKQIIRNLLDNSIKYSGDSVEIVINSRIEGDKGVISVTDNGIGIPEKDLPEVFERFYQAEGIDTREHGGVGLGLAITRELVESMGGTIEVESEPGEGSVFTFTLPIAN